MSNETIFNPRTFLTLENEPLILDKPQAKKRGPSKRSITFALLAVFVLGYALSGPLSAPKRTHFAEAEATAEATVTVGDNAEEPASSADSEDSGEEKKGFFAKIIDWFKNLFTKAKKKAEEAEVGF